jgi:hypothetical protein
MFTSADVSERTFCADGSRASDAAVRSAAREAVMWQRADHASPCHCSSTHDHEE